MEIQCSIHKQHIHKLLIAVQAYLVTAAEMILINFVVEKFCYLL